MDNNLPNRKRGDSDCETDIEPSVGLSRPTREVKPCDAPEVIPPLEFSPPNGLPSKVAETLRVPDPLVVGNDTYTATCAALGGGLLGPTTTFTVTPGELLENIYFEGLGMSNAELLRLYTLSKTYDLQQIITTEVTAPDIVQMIGVTLSDATEILARKVDSKNRLNAAAAIIADGSLDCKYGNEALWVSCNTANPTQATEPVDGFDFLPVLADTFLGDTQELANADAVRVTRAGLSCTYGNPEVTVVCEDAALQALHNQYFLTRNLLSKGGDQSTPTSGRQLVATVTISADTIFSDTVEDATEQAEILGRSQLKCFYPSSAYSTNCFSENTVVSDWAVAEGLTEAQAQTGLGGSPAVVVSSYNPATIEESSGKSAAIPEGYFISDISFADANAQAETFALSLLECYWTNEAYACECPVGYDVDGSVIPTSNLEAGEIVSYSGPVTEDTLSILCESQLQCIFCNDKIDPLCLAAGYSDIPEAHEGSNLANPLLLPLPPAVYATPGLEWSTDTTQGVPAGVICLPDKPTVDSIALSVAAVPAAPPAVGDDSCRYVNERIVVGCVPGVGIDESKFDAIDGADLSVDSSDPVTVAAGVLTVTQKEVDDINTANMTSLTPVEYANQLATNMGLSFLNCFFENNTVEVMCFDGVTDAGGDVALPAPTTALGVTTYGDGSMTTTHGVVIPVAASSYGSTTRKAIVKEKTFISYTSKDESNLLAATMAVGLLDCYWENPELRVYCGAELSQLGVANAFETDSNLQVVNTVTLGDGMLGTADGPDYEFNDVNPTVLPVLPPTSTTVFGDLDGVAYEDLPDGSPLVVSAVTVCGGAPTDYPAGVPGEVDDYRDVVHASSDQGIVVRAGSVRSSASYFDAVSEAFQGGIAELDCVFKNRSMSAACKRHDPWDEVLCTQPAPVTRAEDKFAVGAVTDANVRPGTLVSTISQFDVDSQAWVTARGSLSCLYTNYEVVECCAEVPPEGGWWLETVGVVPECVVVSPSSSQDAGLQAQHIASAKARCFAYPVGEDGGLGITGGSFIKKDSFGPAGGTGLKFCNEACADTDIGVNGEQIVETVSGHYYALVICCERNPVTGAAEVDFLKNVALKFVPDATLTYNEFVVPDPAGLPGVAAGRATLAALKAAADVYGPNDKESEIWYLSSVYVGDDDDFNPVTVHRKVHSGPIIMENMGCDSPTVEATVGVPWKLTTTSTGDPVAHTYRVSSEYSSIMESTNGAAIDLSAAGLDVDTAITATRFIVLEASVTGTTIDSWLITAYATDEPEIELTAVAPIEQTYIRLRIGKVVISGGVATAIQYAEDCKVIDSLFVNGVIAQGFSSHPFTE